MSDHKRKADAVLTDLQVRRESQSGKFARHIMLSCDVDSPVMDHLRELAHGMREDLKNFDLSYNEDTAVSDTLQVGELQHALVYMRLKPVGLEALQAAHIAAQKKSLSDMLNDYKETDKLLTLKREADDARRTLELATIRLTHAGLKVDVQKEICAASAFAVQISTKAQCTSFDALYKHKQEHGL